MARRVFIGVFIASIASLTGGARVDRAERTAPAQRPAALSLPVLFEADDSGKAVTARARGYSMRVEAGGALLYLRGGARSRPVELSFEGGAGIARPERPLDTRINYLRGPEANWRTGVQAYGAARIDGLYDGIDAVFYGTDRDVEYDLIVAPGRDAGQIRLRFGGVDRVWIEDGELRLRAGAETLTHRAPVAYQQVGGRRTPVAARYALASDDSVGLVVGAYDTTAPLVIDPVISYSTYFGATGADTIRALAADAAGGLYIVGASRGGDLPGSTSARDDEFHDGYIARLRPDGTPEWVTLLAGSRTDGASAVAVGPDGDAYVAGFSYSFDFPVTAGAFSSPVEHNCDTFVMRIGADGVVRYSTMLGAPQPWGNGCGGTAIVVDPQSRANVAGATASPAFVPTIPSFGPARPGLDQPDAYVARFSADGSRLELSRLIAGSGYDYASAIARDRFGNLYVAGSTSSDDFPMRDAINPRKLGPVMDPDGFSGYDGFLTMVWDNGTIGFSTYLGGSGEDSMNAVAVGLYDRVYVGGTTNSADASFYKPSAPGQYNGILYHIIPKSTGLLASRPVGGTGFTSISSLAVGSDWAIWVAGYTDGEGWRVNGPDDPAPQQAAAGGVDMFVDKWGAEINGLTYSYLLGGTGDDHGLGIALDPLGDIYVAGSTTSSNFPVRSGVQPARRDAGITSDGFITKLGCYLNPFLPVATQPASGGSGSAPVFASAGCAIAAVSDSAWLRITGSDARNVYFTTDPNPTAAERHATITLSSKKIVPITQAAGTGTGPAATAGEIVLNPRDVTSIFGNWQLVPDEVHGSILSHPDRGQPKIVTASPNPAEGFTFTFSAEAGKPYHLWIHGRARNDDWRNDSIYAQFSDSADASGKPIFRIGTSSATWVSLEECSGCGEQGWGWQDNQYGARGDLGPDIYFATSGTHTIQFQTREDGFEVGQVVLSPRAYLRSAPGGAMNDPTIVTIAEPAPAPPPPAPRDEIVLWTAAAAGGAHGTWRAVADTTAAGQASLWNPDAGAPKLAAPFAAPANYLDIRFDADAGKPYHLWLRMKADNDHWTNDSVWIQFSGSVDASGRAISRIGSAEGTWVSLEECSGCGEQGWGWQDNAYGSPGDLGAPIYFAVSGPQTIRLQVREDGLAIDQVVLSAVKYAAAAPGANRNDATILPRTPR